MNLIEVFFLESLLLKYIFLNICTEFIQQEKKSLKSLSQEFDDLN